MGGVRLSQESQAGKPVPVELAQTPGVHAKDRLSHLCNTPKAVSRSKSGSTLRCKQIWIVGGDRYRIRTRICLGTSGPSTTTTTPSPATRGRGAAASAILADMSDGPPLANLITLGAHDFTTLRDFYRRLGWVQVMDSDDFAAFELRGIVLAVFPLDQLARDGRCEPDPGTGGIRFTIGITVEKAEAVDVLAEKMRQAGARVTKEPVDAEFFVGRSAYLCDPEGNYFEIVWAKEDNPVSAAVRRSAGL